MPETSQPTQDVDIPLTFNDSRVLQILTQSIYHSPLSVFRELVRNAWEAIQAANQGNSGVRGDDCIYVQVESETCTFIIEDSGKGLTYNEVKGVYSVLGETSKSPLSSLGIGSKSPFLVANSYVVQTRAKESEPLNFTVTSKGLKFITDPATLPPLPHVGTKITIPFDPSKVEITKLVQEIQRLVTYLPVPVYFDNDGDKNMISKHDFAALVAGKGDGAITWDNKDWRVIANILDPPGRDHYIHVFVDYMPIEAGWIQEHYFPCSDKVVLLVKNKDLIEVAADRETIVDNDANREAIAKIEGETERKHLAKLFNKPFDVRSIFPGRAIQSALSAGANTSMEKVEDCELRNNMKKTLDRLIDQLEPKERDDYYLELLGWTHEDVKNAQTLFNREVTIILGQGKKVSESDDMRRKLIEAFMIATASVYYTTESRGPVASKILPSGAVLVTMNARRANDEWTRDLKTTLERCGATSAAALESETHGPAKHVAVYRVQESGHACRLSKEIALPNDVMSAIVVPSVSSLEKIERVIAGWPVGERAYIILPKTKELLSAVLRNNTAFGVFQIKAEAIEVTVDGNRVKLVEAVTTARWSSNPNEQVFLVPLPIEAAEFVEGALTMSIKIRVQQDTGDTKWVIVKPVFTDTMDDFEMILQYLAFMTDLDKSQVTVFDVFNAIVKRLSVTKNAMNKSLRGMGDGTRRCYYDHILSIDEDERYIVFHNELVWHLPDALRVLRLLLSDNKHIRDLTADALSMIPCGFADRIDPMLCSIETMEREG